MFGNKRQQIFDIYGNKRQQKVDMFGNKRQQKVDMFGGKSESLFALNSLHSNKTQCQLLAER